MGLHTEGGAIVLKSLSEDRLGIDCKSMGMIIGWELTSKKRRVLIGSFYACTSFTKKLTMYSGYLQSAILSTC